MLQIEIIKKKLMPVTEFLWREKIARSLLEAVDQLLEIAICTAVLCCAVSVICWFFTINILLSKLYVAIVLLAVIVLFVFRYREDINCFSMMAAAHRIDSLINQHNEVAHACELVETGRDSGFAQLAIMDGMEKLDRFESGQLRMDIPAVDVKKLVLTVLIITGVFVFDHYWSRTELVSESLDMKDNEAYIGAAGEKNIDIELEPTVLAENRVSLSNDISNLSGSDKIPDFSDTYDIGYSINSNKAIFSDVNEAGRSDNKKTDSNPLAADMVRAGKSGSGMMPLKEVMADSGGDFNALAADDDQGNADSDEKVADSDNSPKAEQPILDDREAAPGRELGRSGKNGKPGSGRGGTGSVKKSRATAAILSGETINVFLKSRKSKGHSKSYLTENKVYSTGENAGSFAGDAAQEQCQQLYYIEDDLRDITRKYFEGLNNYANRMFTTGK